MTTMIYVDWYDHIIIANAKEKEELLNEWIEANNDIKSFEKWLGDNYSSMDIYIMTENKKEELSKEYEKYVQTCKLALRNKGEKAFCEDFEAICIEVNKYDE